MILRKFRIEFDLRYAITEIVLVAIAILLALAADQWWQERADRRSESGYLARLKDDIRRDISLVDFWTLRMEEKRRFVDMLKSGAIDELLEQEESELWNSFNVSSLPCFPPLQSASYTELESTGQLGLLRDVSVRQELASYYSIFEGASQAANRNAPLEYNAIVLRRFPSDIAYSAAVLGEIRKPEVAAGLEMLRSDPNLSDAATAESNYAVACIESLSQLRDRAQKLQTLLD